MKNGGFVAPFIRYLRTHTKMYFIDTLHTSFPPASSVVGLGLRGWFSDRL